MGTALTFFSIIVVVIFIVLLRGYVEAYGMSYESKLLDSKERLEIVDLAHTVEHCFLKTGSSERFLTIEFLEENDGEKLEKICGIKNPEIYVKIVDIDIDNEWNFGGKKSKAEHDLWVNIIYKNMRGVENEEENIMYQGQYMLTVERASGGMLSREAIKLTFIEKEFDFMEGPIPREIEIDEMEDIYKEVKKMKVDQSLTFRFISDTTFKAKDFVPQDYIFNKVGDLKAGKTSIWFEIESPPSIHMGLMHVEI